MAEEKDQFEKTEEPTPKRQEDARKKGQIAKSRLLLPAVIVLAAGAVLSAFGQDLLLSIGRIARVAFSLAGARHDLTSQELYLLAEECTWLLLPMFAALYGAVMLAGVTAGFLQTGFLFTGEPLQPKWSKINPISGLKRLFSLDAIGELVKAFLLIGCIGGLGYVVLRASVVQLSVLPTLEIGEILLFGSEKGVYLLQAGAVIIGVLAGFDYWFQFWRTKQKMRMSLKEVKDEMRKQEGDPLLKGRLKGLRQKMARQRMMAEVPQADVVITNPTELAVALRYHIHAMAAPQVVAKGAGLIAARIREVARAHGIPLVENKPLARLLHRQVEIGQEVPENLYRAVAEVLAYVMRMRRGQPDVRP